MSRINYHRKNITWLLLFCFIFFLGINGFPVKQKSEEKGLKLLTEAEALFEEYEYQAALNKFNQAGVYLKDKKNLVRLYLSMSKLYYEMDEKVKTGEILKKMFQIDPGKQIIQEQYPRGYLSIFQKLQQEFKAKIQVSTVKKKKDKIEVIETPATKINGENGTIEKVGKKKKKKKFPTLLVIGGIIVVGLLVYFLLIKKGEKYTLTVSKGEGINGTPASGSTEYEKDTNVNYSYSLQAGYSELHVLVDGAEVAASGSIKMDRNHTLNTTTSELGSIRVESDPTSAAIWLDGDNTGQSTNNTLNNVVPGSHTVKLVKSGYYDWETEVTVNAGEQATVSADLVKDVAVSWVSVTGGSFNMGSNSGFSREKPVHQVNLDSFYISKYEVTFEQYDAFCDVTGRTKPSDTGWGRGDRPVINVSWDDAVAFCDWLSAQTGQNIHLPTEAQWEFAARGGNSSNGYTYSGSNNVDTVGWYGGNSGGKTNPVGQKLANELGIHDMSGNVWEWCSDWFGENYYSSSPVKNPTGPPNGSSRVVRGGSWYNDATSLRSAFRNYDTPSDTYNRYLGFRLCRD